jgi:RNA polymerase sigma-70 factor, ECF subfamily
MNKRTSLEAIYEQYFHDVYRYIYSLCHHTALTEDIVQETFYRSYDYLDSLKDEKVKPWLFKVAYHTFIDMYRKEQRHIQYALNAVQQSVPSPEDQLVVKQDIERWFTVANELSEMQRNIIQLRDYHHFSYDEIANLTGLTLANVKVQLFRARKMVQKKLQERDE